MIKPCLVALQFLTRFPVHIAGNISERSIGQSILYYPLVGLLIGAILVGIMMLLNTLLPTPLLAALLITLWVLITGALHLDGLADSADAWLGGHGDKERTLSIMKDPRCGSAAVVILVLILLTKFSAMQAILDSSLWPSLLVIPVLSRTSLLLLFLTTPYVRKNGLGQLLADHLPRRMSWIITGLVSILILIFIDNSLWLLGITAIVFLALRGLMMKRLQGFTGDTAGALVEILEVALLTVAIIISDWNDSFLI